MATISGPPSRPSGGGRIDARDSAMPATECIGAGRLEGWFVTPAHIAESRGWGHIESYCFEGSLFFHLQRSPLLRGVNYHKKDEVTFEVVEINGKCEAVKLLMPRQMEAIEAHKAGEVLADEQGRPKPDDLVGQRVQGAVDSTPQLMLKQKWGFVISDHFSGKIFWHITDNPTMMETEWNREDLVEFDIYMDHERNQVRAKNMVWLAPRLEPIVKPRMLSERKRLKREEYLANWFDGPPPDWDCTGCGFHNFGRNKLCKQCNIGERPPRSEWKLARVEVKRSDIYNPQTTKSAPKVVAPPGAAAVQSEPYGGGGQVVAPPGAAGGFGQADIDPRQQGQWQGQQQQQQAPAPGAEGGKLGLCMSAFNDLVKAHNPQGVEDSLNKVKMLLNEINEVLGQDRNAKHAFSMHLSQHAWVAGNNFEVRFMPSRNTIGIEHKAIVPGGGMGGGGGGGQKRPADGSW